MDRREVLKLSGLGLGFTLSGSALLSLIASCKSEVSNGVGMQALETDNFAFLETLAEIILPKTTESPGAGDVQVSLFLDSFVSKVYDEAKQKQFNNDLAILEKECKAKYGKILVACDDNEKVEFVKGLESSEYEPAVNIWGNQVFEGSEMPFYKQLKSMILWAYFTSEKVGKEVLTYQQLAPDFQGCVDVTAETRLRSI